jgi:hypothetical protein
VTDKANVMVDIAAHADALTQCHTHREQRWTWDRNRNRKPLPPWVTTQPALLDQLAAAVVPSEVHLGARAGARTLAHSVPPARLDAIDRCLAIQAGVSRWCAILHLEPSASTAGNIQAIVEACRRLDLSTASALLIDLRTWHYWAATVCGWRTPPWKPAAACPLCGARDTLRVRLDARTACCLSCGEGWGPQTIRLLAEAVRTNRPAETTPGTTTTTWNLKPAGRTITQHV